MKAVVRFFDFIGGLPKIQNSPQSRLTVDQ